MSLSFNRTGLLAAIPCMMLTPVLKLKMRFGINDFMLFSLLLFVKQLHHPFNYIRPRYAKYCTSTAVHKIRSFHAYSVKISFLAAFSYSITATG